MEGGERESARLKFNILSACILLILINGVTQKNGQAESDWVLETS